MAAGLMRRVEEERRMSYIRNGCRADEGREGGGWGREKGGLNPLFPSHTY